MHLAAGFSAGDQAAAGEPLTDVTRYPLTWPAGWARRPSTTRRRALFGQSADAGGYYAKQPLSVMRGIERLLPELDRLGAREVIVSTNLRTRLDGWPRSDQAEPADPGVAVYFELEKVATVLACDRWDRVADNLAAIAAHVEAIRAIERYGVGSLAQAFAGYRQLPETALSDWRAVMGYHDTETPTLEQMEARYRELAREAHPDVGGDAGTMAALNRARDDARKELGR